MIRRDEFENGVVVYRSSLIEDFCGDVVVHGFSTRLSGLSPRKLFPEKEEQGEVYCGGDYEGLDLGVEGEAKYTSANWRKLRKVMGMRRMVRREVRQVHGGEVKTWSSESELVKLCHAPEADGMVSGNQGEILAIRTADCGSVLLVGKDGHGDVVIGALHAGWRSVVAGVVEKTVKEMVEMGVDVGGVVGAVGPCIGVGAFEVGEEVVSDFRNVGLEDCVVRGGGMMKPHIDLRGAIARQLEEAGVSNSRIDVCDVCTFERADEFYSYRRSVGRNGLGGCGRMAAVIGKK
ncbi:Laccase domain protein YfiH [Poriferisphaera corsica]|uniref:Laccase domain protein YfiH n=1 Tax=Poriferisphaera corsica TaxID=2528020 RepID=A0A517YXW1_9BACT|nr:polyphenol oxidase family protein [Poriferisphaera corsica]QDU35063.1 Laccase domain protein YfiH [Poriferisphaera corsica]